MDKKLLAAVKRLDQYDLRRLIMYAQGALDRFDGPRFEALESPKRHGKVTYRCELVMCGKSSCRSCPHGPYWYAYWREGGRLKSRYVGKQLPDEVDE